LSRVIVSFKLEQAATIVVVIVALLACATTSGADLARARAAREYDCPQNRIRVRWLSHGPRGHQIYKVEACGVVATYACEEEEETCLKESDDRRQ
jgi:hypothetical protein